MTQPLQKEKNMEQANRLAALRGEMKKHGINGFLIPRADEFMGEYVPARGERLAWISGFTGSAGVAAVLENDAVVTTDDRYDIQIEKEVDENLFTRRVTKVGFGLVEWLHDNMPQGQVLGYDPFLHTGKTISEMQAALKAQNITLKPVAGNLIDAIWADQPGAPTARVEVFPEAIAGRSAQEKRESIGTAIAASGAEAAVVTQPDSIAWLLNIRGNDVPHTPFALSYAIVYADARVDWFIDKGKITPQVQAHIGNQVQVKDPATLEDSLKGLAGKAVQYDPERSAIWFRQVLESAGVQVVAHENPCVLPKACKTLQEQDAMRNAHLRDGINVTKFLVWLDREGGKGNLSELDVVDRLESFRRLDKGFRDSSFDTICGWAAHGAIVHYRATPESNVSITPPGILLLDSGAQYLEGTTDITRTIAIGEPTPEQKKAFTLVLRGHIGIADAPFPEGTRGVDLDVLAHLPLRKAGMDYGHGTGHGVGCYLSVHEEGGGLSSRAMRAFRPGMVVSNEPGYYKKDSFGIRIENLVLVRENGMIEDVKAMAFETLTLVPIDRRLIAPELMQDDELAWLNAYHARVARELTPHLDADEVAWLKEATKPIKKPDAASPKPASRLPSKKGPDLSP